MARQRVARIRIERSHWHHESLAKPRRPRDLQIDVRLVAAVTTLIDRGVPARRIAEFFGIDASAVRALARQRPKPKAVPGIAKLNR